MNKCYLALGGNLSHPRRNIRGAHQYLRKLKAINLHKTSSLYLTLPWGIKAQPNYWNCVIAISTRLAPLALLKQCQIVEKKFNRQRKQRWGSRTLDIDLLMYENVRIHTEKLTLPHPEMLKRDFVLTPLFEIAPQFVHTLKSITLNKTIIRKEFQYGIS